MSIQINGNDNVFKIVGFTEQLSLDVEQLDNMRVKFQSLKVVLIDEISMVGNKMFNFINLRLQEICGNNIPFGGVSIIAIGDLYQLKPVFDGWIFENISEGFGPLSINLWTDLFQRNYETKR